MKKIILSILCLISLNQAFAQDNHFSLGIRAGLNGSFIGKVPDKVEKDGTLLGAVGGIYARFHTRGGTNLYFQPEIMVSQTGSRGKFNFDNPDTFINTSGDFRTTLTNIDVPFLIGLRLGIKNIGVRVNGGPLVSYAFNAKRKVSGKIDNDGLITTLDLNEDIKNDINQLQAGFQVGAGVDLGAINIDVRYQYNFTKLYKDATYNGNIAQINYSIPQGDSQIRALQVTVGIKIL